MKKACHCDGVKRLKQSRDAANSLEIAASTLKNSYFSVFPRNDRLLKFCGDPSDSDPKYFASGPRGDDDWENWVKLG